MTKGYKDLTEQDKKDIIELYYQNIMTIEKMTKELGLTRRAIPQVLREAGINTKIINRYTLNEDYFSDIDCEEKAYLLGLLYADGFVGGKKTNNISISLKEEDGYMLEKLADLIEFTGKTRVSKGVKEYGEYANRILNFSSPKMASDLRDLGLYPGKSATMEDIPEIREDLFHHFARGYFDGDGSISITRYIETDRRTAGKVRIYERENYTFTMIGTVEFLRKVADKLPVKTYFEDSRSDNMVYLKSRSEPSLCEIYKYLYDDSYLFLERKFNKWNEVIGAINEKSLMKMG